MVLHDCTNQLALQRINWLVHLQVLDPGRLRLILSRVDVQILVDRDHRSFLSEFRLILASYVTFNILLEDVSRLNMRYFLHSVKVFLHVALCTTQLGIFSLDAVSLRHHDEEVISQFTNCLRFGYFGQLDNLWLRLVQLRCGPVWPTLSEVK